MPAKVLLVKPQLVMLLRKPVKTQCGPELFPLIVIDRHNSQVHWSVWKRPQLPESVRSYQSTFDTLLFNMSICPSDAHCQSSWDTT